VHHDRRNIAETGILNFKSCFPVGCGFTHDAISHDRYIEFFIRTAKKGWPIRPGTAQKN